MPSAALEVRPEAKRDTGPQMLLSKTCTSANMTSKTCRHFGQRGSNLTLEHSTPNPCCTSLSLFSSVLDLMRTQLPLAASRHAPGEACFLAGLRSIWESWIAPESIVRSQIGSCFTLLIRNVKESENESCSQGSWCLIWFLSARKRKSAKWQIRILVCVVAFCERASVLKSPIWWNEILLKRLRNSSCKMWSMQMLRTCWCLQHLESTCHFRFICIRKSTERGRFCLNSQILDRPWGCWVLFLNVSLPSAKLAQNWVHAHACVGGTTFVSNVNNPKSIDSDQWQALEKPHLVWEEWIDLFFKVDSTRWDVFKLFTAGSLAVKLSVTHTTKYPTARRRWPLLVQEWLWMLHLECDHTLRTDLKHSITGCPAIPIRCNRSQGHTRIAPQRSRRMPQYCFAGSKWCSGQQQHNSLSRLRFWCTIL